MLNKSDILSILTVHMQLLIKFTDIELSLPFSATLSYSSAHSNCIEITAHEYYTIYAMQ